MDDALKDGLNNPLGPDHALPVVALVLAGGTGSRMGRPKQFIDLLGGPRFYIPCGPSKKPRR